MKPCAVKFRQSWWTEAVESALRLRCRACSNGTSPSAVKLQTNYSLSLKKIILFRTFCMMCNDAGEWSLLEHVPILRVLTC